MLKKEIKQEAHASTLMSSIKSAYNYYYNEELSDAMLFGLSGHAFVVHITNGLGPCAPYTFDMTGFIDNCINNLGLDMFGTRTMITNESDDNTKELASNLVKSHLDNDHLVLLCSYEYQIIKDYNDSEFLVTTPWDDTFSVTPNMKLDSFDGMKEFITFFKISKQNKVNIKEAIKNSLQYAVDFYNFDDKIDSGIGKHAYDFWLSKMTEENASAHGNWWTSSVWAESRRMASLYITEIKEYLKNDEVSDELIMKYQKSSELFSNIANKELGYSKKVELVKELKRNEEEIIVLLETLL